MKSESKRARSSSEVIFEILKHTPFISSAYDLFPLQHINLSATLQLCTVLSLPGENTLWHGYLQIGVSTISSNNSVLDA